jgi:hypothetical protein
VSGAWSSVPTAGASQATPTALGTVYAKQTTSGASPYLTAFGYNAGKSTTGSSNSAFGQEALYTNTSGTSNTALGYQALFTVNVGGANTGVGVYALYANTASNNSALGYNSLGNNTSGSSNSAFGTSALSGNLSGSYNVAIGDSALQANNSGASNTSCGYQSLLANLTGSYNVALGHQSLYASNSPSSNTCIGAYSGYYLTIGANNTFIGYDTGGGTGGHITSGSENIRIGYGVGGSTTGVNYSLLIGTNGSVDKGSSTGYINPNSGGVYQGNNAATWSVTSDERLKKNIVDNNVGLDKISQIRIRNFEYRLPEEVDASLKPTDAIKIQGVQLGVIAQELQQILPDCVKQESTSVLALEHDNIMWHMINAIKELNAKVIALETKLGV